jgi:hypoxanthine phosphoribosyltransferase
MISRDELRRIIDTSTCLYNNDEIEAALNKMAEKINTELSQKQPIFLCVMVGALITTGRLLPKLSIDLQTDYIHASRYGDAASGTKIKFHATPNIDFKDRTIVMVDDVLDGGLTLSAVKDYCLQYGASEVLSAVLIDKPSGRDDGGIEKPDFNAVTVGDCWLIGSGLDYKGYLRNLPGIYAMDPKVVTEEYS